MQNRRQQKKTMDALEAQLREIVERKKPGVVIEFRKKRKLGPIQRRLIAYLDCSVNEFGDVEYAEA